MQVCVLLWQASSWINLTFTDQSNCLITTFCPPCHRGPLLTRVWKEHPQGHLQKIFHLIVGDLQLSPEVICDFPVSLSYSFNVCSELFDVGSCSSQMEWLQQSYLSSGLSNYPECSHEEDCFISNPYDWWAKWITQGKALREGYGGKGTNLAVWCYLYSLHKCSQRSHFPCYIVNYSNE